MNHTIEHQNQPLIDTYIKNGPVRLGPWSSHLCRSDPRHLLFVLSRYKFVSKLMIGKKQVLEVGCGDCLGIPIVLQSVEKVTAVDIEPLIIKDIEERMDSEVLKRCDVNIVDYTNDFVNGNFDAAYSLDVIEHIAKSNECSFMKNIIKSLNSDGFLIIGTPNISAHQYSSQYSKICHINLKNAESLKELLKEFFNQVIIFSMNDELVHTGYFPMAHYLFGVGFGKKTKSLA